MRAEHTDTVNCPSCGATATPPSDACTIPEAARVSGGKLHRPKGAKVKVVRRGGVYIVRTTSRGITQRTAYVRRGKRKRDESKDGAKADAKESKADKPEKKEKAAET